MLSTNFAWKHTPGEGLFRKVLHVGLGLFGITDKPENSAKSVLCLIDQVVPSGKYYDKDKMVASFPDRYDEEKARLLWTGSEELVGQSFLPMAEHPD